MDTLQAIEKRWGCRKYLIGKPVTKDILGKVLDAGRFAPSAGNLQDRSFIVVRKPETKTAIAEAAGNQSWMQDAPVHIIVLSENKKLGKFFGQKGEKMYAIQDTSFAVENMLLAATSLGLGCSLAVGFNEEKITQLLEIPSPAQPHAIIVIGYPAEPATHSTKDALENFVFFESYGEKTVTMHDAVNAATIGVKQEADAAVQTTKKGAQSLLAKILAFFSKKKETQPMVDHFMEPGQNQTFLETHKDGEIPRQLPKRF